MTKKRACANGPSMSRRTLLSALPVASATLASPAAAEVRQTEILRLFHHHQDIIDAAGRHVCVVNGEAEDKELERLFYHRADRIAAKLMALPCTCAADFAAKVIVDTCKGGLFSDWETGAIWQEARALTSK